mmetsp:Transcript_23279/g.40236  ORF Transcript_23279/g.40236 Transcript_23279/m.40236 type:complete len:217 (-) Transcript_23279:3-653(-)
MDRVFGDAEVHIPQRLQAAKPFAHVFYFENTHVSGSLFRRCGFAVRRVVGRFFALEEARNTLSALNQTTRQEDHDRHKDQAKRQVPALADERIDQGDDKVLKPIRQECKPCVQDVAVDLGQDVFHVLDRTGPQNGTNQCADTAQNGHQNNFARGGPEHAFSPHLRVHRHHQPAGQTGIHARDHKGRQRVGFGVQPGIVQPVLVRFDRAQHHPKKRK